MKNAVIGGEKYLKSVVSMEKVSPREGHPRSGIKNNLSIKLGTVQLTLDTEDRLAFVINFHLGCLM